MATDLDATEGLSSGRPRLRRFLPATLLATWMILSGVWWLSYALLLPFATIPNIPTRHFAGFATTGEALFTTREAEQPPNPTVLYRGPLEFWSLDSAQKTIDRFTADDVIESLATAPGLLTVIRRRDERWIADLATGELLHTLPPAPIGWRACFVAGSGRVLYALPDQLVCFDYVNQSVVWKLDQRYGVRTCTDRYAVIVPLRASGNNFDWSRPMFIRLADGTPVPGIEPFHPCEHWAFSPDGQLFVFGDVKQVRVLDIERNWVVWQHDPSTGPRPWGLQFSDDSSELIQKSITYSGRLNIGRIRLRDGEILAPLKPPTGEPTLTRYSSMEWAPRPHFAVFERRSGLEKYWNMARGELVRLGNSIGWNFKWLRARNEKVVVNTETGTILGPITDRRTLLATFLVSPTGNAFMTQDSHWHASPAGSANRRPQLQMNDWKVYHIPPGRNWPLLAILWSVPVAVWGVFSLLVRLWRLRGRTGRAPASAAE